LNRRPADSGATAVADAELQGDVMRFVAILALCLVAISTLVDRGRDAASETRSAVAVQPLVKNGTSASPEATPETLQAIGGADGSSRTEAPNVPVTVTAAPLPARPAMPVEPSGRPRAQTDPPDPAKGLSLRFATDAALLRMVARGDAEVFVFDGPRTLALDLSDGVGFRAANPPPSYYAMSPATVPALLRTAHGGSVDATWGVTLPEPTTAEIDRYLGRHDSGVLVINAAGGVGLESGDD
jgi:hypothetical protein